LALCQNNQYIVNMIFDLHVHTAYSSCSNLRLDDILSQARSRGLDGICITDHNTMDSRRELPEGIQDNGLCVLIGMEYDTPEGDFLLFGSFDDLKPGLSARELLMIVEEKRGAVIGAHPFREGRSLREDILGQGGCRIIEGLNGRNSQAENRKAQSLTLRFPLFQCGGSDAHSLEELGGVVTCFAERISSRQELIYALKSGNYYPAKNNRFAARPYQDRHHLENASIF
jgi:predicted metal-dependent phosphoesterase TrpH